MTGCLTPGNDTTATADRSIGNHIRIRRKTRL